MDGTTCEAVSLIFKDGRIEKASGNPQAKIDAVFATDEGARYVGEFAPGINPHITRPMKERWPGKTGHPDR